MSMKLPPTEPIAQAANKSIWEKVITSTPVVMAVLSTLLAGLSSSEMSSAQYYRSIAAQDQSKVGDQWAFFQAKRNRGEMKITTAEMMTVQGGADATFSPASLTGITGAPSSLTQLLADAKTQQALKLLSDEPLPPIDTSFITDPSLQTAYKALNKGESESIAPKIFEDVKESVVHDALLRAEEQTLTISDTFGSPMKTLHNLKAELGKFDGTDAQAKRVKASFAAAEMRFDAARQAREAQANQVTAYLYEIQVHRASIQSERHRIRSRYFFFGMLGAQVAVTIATIAIAAREKNTLWTLATAIGAVAVTYAGYVYLFT
jgi:hypothetical protein